MLVAGHKRLVWKEGTYTMEELVTCIHVYSAAGTCTADVMNIIVIGF
jgi:hypothetical protein